MKKYTMKAPDGSRAEGMLACAEARISDGRGSMNKQAACPDCIAACGRHAVNNNRSGAQTYFRRLHRLQSSGAIGFRDQVWHRLEPYPLLPFLISQLIILPCNQHQPHRHRCRLPRCRHPLLHPVPDLPGRPGSAAYFHTSS